MRRIGMNAVRAGWVLLIAVCPAPASEVPSPWPALRADGARIETWGRMHAIGADGLPTSIRSAGEELLAGPVYFSFGPGSEPAKAECRFEPASPQQAGWTSTGTWGGLDYRCRGLIEFDGMMRLDAVFQPQGASRLDRLHLVVPLRRSQATLLHFFPPPYDFPQITWFRPERPNSIARPQRWACRFTPFVWLGNEWRGLQWFCESDEGWRPADPEAALEIAEHGEEVRLTVRLLDGPAVLDRPFTLTFGLMAGPVKPKPATFSQGTFGYLHWASYALAETQPEGTACPLDRRRAMGARFLGMHEDWTDYQGMSRATQPDRLRRLVQEVHRRGMGLVLYHYMSIPDNAPEFAELADECLCEPRSAFYVHTREPAQRAYVACHRSRWSQVFTDGIAALFADYGIDGVYLDGAAGPFWCANARHGCGYDAPDGSRRPTFPIFAVRDQMRRIRAICDAAGRPTLIVAHMSAMITLPTLSFADLLLTGEQYWKAPDDFRPPLEFFRVECMGHPHGIPTDFIGYRPLGGDYARTMIGLHHAPSSWCPGGVETWRLYRDFDVDAAAWWPYWGDEHPATADRTDVLVSGFGHVGRRALLAVGSLAGTEAEVVLSLNAELAGLGPGSRVRDAESGEPLEIEAGRLRVRLGPESLRWLLWEGAGAGAAGNRAGQ